MKLLASLLACQVAHGQAIEGGCTDGESAMTCVTECPHTDVGKKFNARHKLMFDGDDSVTVRLSPSPKSGMHKEENVDFRFTMRFDKQKCSKAILNAINDGTLSLEVADKNDVYDIESIYMDLETCPGWQQALYVQVKHSNPDGLNEWTYKPSANNHRDQFYLTMYGLRDIGSIGKARSDVKTCLEQVWVDRMNEMGEEDSDFTKCMMYDRCSKTPDWDSTPTTTTTTTTTTTPGRPDGLPDYNDDDYTFTNDGVTCTLVMSDGQTFLGYVEDDLCNFAGIPYAEPPTQNLRWKSPRLLTSYQDTVDGTSLKYGCATFTTGDDPSQGNASEDCLHVNVQVPITALENKEKLPMVAFIHGGAFNFGSNNASLHGLAKQGLVTVNIGYRLGPYGFMYLEETEEGEFYKGNWGLQDQLAGLKWISMYGGVFGGDKEQVTLDGCSAGSQAGWHHLTSEDSWPYFSRAVTNGVGLPAGIYYEESGKPTQITNYVLDHAGVSSIDELRQLSTGELQKSLAQTNKDLGSGADSVKVAPLLDPFWGPVIDGVMLKDHLIHLVRDGHVRPNTPISINYSKDDPWSMLGEPWAYMRDTMFPVWSEDIESDELSTGFFAPPDWQNKMFEAIYGSDNYGPALNEVFGCKNNDADCKEEFARFITASTWVCNTRWALLGAYATNNSNLGEIYPMQFSEPNCGADENGGVHDKTCHCSESAYIHGDRALPPNASGLAIEMRDTFINFYKTGSFTDGKIKSWSEMNYDAFNFVKTDTWKQKAIKSWDECTTMDAIQDAGLNFYTWGYSKQTPNGVGKPVVEPMGTLAPPVTPPQTTGPPEPTTTALPDFPEEDPLPDFNSTPYTYSCDDDNICTLAMDNGWTFVGVREGTIVNFRNIPFAEPPVGQLRWKSPRVITDYSSLSPVQATEFGPNCATFQAQDNNPTQNQSEDCLHLNIQVAEWVLKNGNVKQPIVAHIHGGAWNFGTNTDSLQSLVSQGMVAININYRLGPYAWLAMPQREEGERYKANWGLLDQLAGLKWIQMMGGIFGGDINQVTLDGCSAGSASGWHHLTSEASWPYFHRAVTNGISFPAGFYFEGTKTDQIRNHVLNHAGVSSIDELRELSTGTLRLSWLDALNTLSPAIKSSPTLDPMYAPVIEGDFIKDHTLYLVRNGHIRPNTPISMNLSKDDAWNFKSEAWEYLRDVPFAALSTDITAASESSGHEIPNPYPNIMFQKMYPSKADRMIAQFGCPNETDDCKEGFGRWVQATHWLCNARWALSGALKENPENYGPIWPMHFEEPNCDAVAPFGSTKTCHCAETAWVRGGRAWNGNDLGLEMKTTWQKFYKTGAFDASSNMKSWQEMNFEMFNRVSSTSWAPGAINNWDECDLLDELQLEQAGYTWGYTKSNPNGLTQQGQ